jgi:hypothetical protein
MGVVVPSDRQQRQNVDFRLSRKRDATAAQLPTALRREAMSESMSGWIAVICSSSAKSN